MRMMSLIGWRLLLIALVLLTSATIAGIGLFRLTTAWTYQPVVTEGKAPLPAVPLDGLNVHDKTTITQHFTATSPVLSHLGIGIHNFRKAAPTASVQLTLRDASAVEIATTQLPVARLEEDGITRVPLFAVLQPENVYTLSVTTQGIPIGDDLSLFYESETNTYADPAALLFVSTTGHAPKQLHGNIGFQLLRLPTTRTLRYTLLRTPWFWAMSLWSLTLLLFSILPRSYHWLAREFSRPLGLPHYPLTRREVIVVAIVAAVLALAITAPYFTNRATSNTPIDLQRALVYRGVAREAALHDHAVALWEPYLCGGMSLIGNAESAHLDPFFLLVLALGEERGLRASVTATLALGFLGTYLLARRFITTSKSAAFLASAVFVYSGFQMLGLSGFFFAWLSVGWVPWFFWLLLASLRKWQSIVPASLAGALLFLGGSVHMTFYAFFTAALLMLFLALRTRRWQPLLCYALVTMLALNFMAIKMLPVSAAQGLVPQYARPIAFVPPVSWLPKMFLDRHQLATPEWLDPATREYAHWVDYGAYVGILPVVFCALAFVWLRRQPLLQAIAAAAGILGLMTYGAWPWPVLHRLPLLNEILRNPQRARSLLLLCGALLAAYGLTKSTEIIRSRYPKRAAWLSWFVTILVLVDLITLHAPLFKNQFKNLPAATPLPAVAHVTRLHDMHGKNIPAYYGGFTHNYGTTDHCLGQLEQLNTGAVGQTSSDPAKPYRGEVFVSGPGIAMLQKRAANHVHIAVEALRPTWVVLNDNYLPGWKTNPPREVRAWEGLVAARITPADSVITFYYKPLAYVVGRTLTLFTLSGGLLTLALSLTGKPRKTTSQKPMNRF